MSNITIIMGYHHRTKQGTPQRTLTSFKGRGLRSVGIIVDNNFAVRHWLWSGGGCDPLFSARSSSRPVSAQLSMRTPSGRHSLLRAKERQAMGGMGPSYLGHRCPRAGKIRYKVDSKLIAFYGDSVMSYPQLIVWALEMRRMMGVRVTEGTIRRLEVTWDAQQTLGVFVEAETSWKEQLRKELQSIGLLRGGRHSERFSEIISVVSSSPKPSTSWFI